MIRADDRERRDQLTCDNADFLLPIITIFQHGKSCVQFRNLFPIT